VKSAQKGPTKLEIGAIVEVPTSRGFGYVQYTHWNDLMGALIRVLPGLHASRPADLEALAREPEAYVTFVPLREALTAGLFELIGRADVPKKSRDFPLFRAAGAREPGKTEPRTWWLWDGKKERKVGGLSPEQMKLPIRSTLMPPVLIARVEAQWRPGEPSPAVTPLFQGDSTKIEGHTWHYLYFHDEETARRAAVALLNDGMQAEAEISARGGDWLVRVPGGQGQGVDEERTKLESVAKQFGGDYDGWQGR
jgi:regulator of ribonuclease activity B